MRLNINLATQPYEDARRFWSVWGAVLAVLFVLTAGLVWTAISDMRHSGGAGRQIRDYRQKIAEAERQRAQAQAFLNRPENRDTRDKSEFINSLIARKAFSWTQVFASLEKIMPPGLQVVSLRPDLDDNNQLQLKMVVAGGTRDRAVELVRRMEDSQEFQKAQVLKENATEQQGGIPKVEFEVSALYVPESIRGGQ